MTMRIAIVDDQPLVRQGFSMILSIEDDIDVVAEAADGAQAVDLLRGTNVDVVVMDVQMPVMDGIEATRIIRAENLAKVLILTTFERDDYIFEAIEAGASGFLLKNAEPERLVEAIRAVGYGHALLSPEVTTRVLAKMSESSATADAPSGYPRAADLNLLTAREREVLMWVAKGLSNAEIAHTLVVGESTVKTHVSNCLAKLGLRDRVQAVGFAYESGLLRTGETRTE